MGQLQSMLHLLEEEVEEGVSQVVTREVQMGQRGEEEEGLVQTVSEGIWEGEGVEVV